MARDSVAALGGERSSVIEDTMAEAGWREILLWILRRRFRCRVIGSSMQPCLSDGDAVLVDRTRSPKIGDIVVARHPFIRNQLIVKRVAGIDGEGRFQLLGDSPDESTDSRAYGPICREALLGVVTNRWSGRK